MARAIIAMAGVAWLVAGPAPALARHRGPAVHPHHGHPINAWPGGRHIRFR